MWDYDLYLSTTILLYFILFTMSMFVCHLPGPVGFPIQHSDTTASSSFSMHAAYKRRFTSIYTCNCISCNHLHKTDNPWAAILLQPLISARGVSNYPSQRGTVRDGTRQIHITSPQTPSPSKKKRKVGWLSVLDCWVPSQLRWMNTATPRLAHDL